MKTFLMIASLMSVSVSGSATGDEPYRTGDPIPSGAVVITNKVLVRESCATPCSNREKSGTCVSFLGQVCGPGYNCVPHCIQREVSGACGLYAADFCGSGAVCQPRCVTHSGDGRCAIYTSDSCSNRL